MCIKYQMNVVSMFHRCSSQSFTRVPAVPLCGRYFLMSVIILIIMHSATFMLSGLWASATAR